MIARLAPWLSRFVLAVATFVLAMIARKYIADPAATAAASGIALRSARAATDARAGLGGFPLGGAAIAFFCLLSVRRHLAGLAAVAAIAGAVLAARSWGAIVDGTFRESLFLLAAETVLLGLCLVAIAAERARRRAAPRRSD